MADNTTTLMGWNQVVWVGNESAINPIKVSDFNVGVKQTFDCPPLVTGLTDAITWQKGKVEVTGRISAPMTLNISNQLLRLGVYSGTTLPDVYFKSTISPEVMGKINSMDITANAGDAITTTVEMFGVLTDSDDIESNRSYWGNSLYKNLGVTSGSGQDLSAIPTLLLEQIPMFDTVIGAQGFLPGGAVGNVTKIDLKIENNLQRNYILGQSTLNAYSISAGQRKLTGNVTYISDTDGALSYVSQAGLSSTAPNTLQFGPVSIDMTGVVILFGANPPDIRPGDVVSVSSNFQLLNTVHGMINIQIEEVA